MNQVTLEEARETLGDEALGLSDEQLQLAVNTLHLIAKEQILKISSRRS